MDQRPAALPRDPTPFSHHGGQVGVLLVHGFCGTPGELRPLAERLADQGYSVEAPLLAGHGGSQEELAAVTWRDWVLSARTALEALRARCHMIAQVGFSMGGAITLYMAAPRPGTGARGAEQPLAGIVTLSALTHLNSPLTVLLPIARHVMPYVYPLRRRNVDLTRPEVIERLRDYIPDLRVDPSNAEQIAALRRGVKVSVGAIYQLNSLLHQVRLRLANVEAPALLIQATHDEQVSPTDVDRIYRSIGSRDKRVVRLERSGHMLLAGAEREAMIGHVATFVRRVAGNPG